MEAVLGAEVAAATGLRPGAEFAGAHGLGGGGAHDSQPYRVSGVLAACGCVLDRLVLTATESVWQLHEAAHGQEADHDEGADDKREITLALIQYKSPLAAVSFPRFVNSTTSMQAAAPALEISRLLRMVGVGAEVLRGFGVVLLLTAALSVFIALWNAVRERRADLAMLRMLGASPARLAALLVCEALWLALLATLLGLAGGHLLTGLLGWMLAAEKSLPLTGWLWLGSELWVAVLALGVALLAALLPAWSAYRVDAGQLLNSR
jgi:putative ABC transport system permease protein